METKTTYMELEVTIRYDYHRAARGSREYPGGPPLEPDEQEYVDVDPTAYITTQAGRKLSFSLTPEQVAALEEEILDDHNQQQDLED